MPELYRWLPLQKIPVPGVGIAIRSRGEFQHLILNPAVAEVICEYGDFRSLGDLIGDAESRLKGSSEMRRSIDQGFHEAIECGLLIPLSRVKNTIATTPCRPLPPLATLIVPTVGRSASLKRCAESFARDASSSGRRFQMIVSDNSGNPESERACCTELERVAKLKDFKVTFVGAIEARAIREKIRQYTGAPFETVEFLLSGIPGKPNIGANRNLLLLLGSGQRVLSADDDMVCEPRTFRYASSTDRTFCESNMSAVDYRAVADERSLEDQTSISSCSLWDSHEEVLGRQCASILRESSFNEHFTIAGDAVKSIIRGAGTIRASYSGIYGDPGIHCRPSIAFLLNQTQNPSGLTEIYDEALTTGDMMIAPRSTVISRGGPWPGGCFGIDLCDITPPFMPCYRGEDWLFGLLLSSSPDAYVAHLAESVLHRPSSAQVTVNFDGAIAIRMADLIRGLCMSTAAAKSSLSTRSWLVRMGTELAGASHDDLYEWLQGVSWSYYRSLIAILEKVKTNVGASDSVIKAIDSLLRAVDRSVHRPDFTVPLELRKESIDGSASKAFNNVYWFVNRFGLCLREWPAIVDAANDLLGAGACMGQVRPESCLSGKEIYQ